MGKMILPGTTIGIIGGGQLGRMMAIAAKEMGYRIAVLEPTPNGPCAQVADIEIVAAYNDLTAIRQLAEVSDVITYEFENIDYACLQWLEENAYLPQGSKLLALTQNRFTEKSAVAELGVQVAPYQLIKNETDLIESVSKMGYPCVLKTVTGGYDGKGQVVMKNETDLADALQLAKKKTCILEGWIAFEKEVSVVVARNLNHETKVFPVSENIHIDNILHQSIVPARITAEIEKKALEIALLIANQFDLIGILAIEMFVTADGKVYVNELAPRPHNSGHYTIDACRTSQFQQHIRAVCNWPLGDTSLHTPVVMVNILGEHVEPILKKIPSFANCKLHLYGKAEAKIKRKMGHLNILANSTEEALIQAANLEIWQ